MPLVNGLAGSIPGVAFEPTLGLFSSIYVVDRHEEQGEERNIRTKFIFRLIQRIYYYKHGLDMLLDWEPLVRFPIKRCRKMMELSRDERTI